MVKASPCWEIKEGLLGQMGTPVLLWGFPRGQDWKGARDGLLPGSIWVTSQGVKGSAVID